MVKSNNYKLKTGELMMKEIKILKTLSLKSGDELVLRTAVPSDAQDVIDYLNIIGSESWVFIITQ